MDRAVSRRKFKRAVDAIRGRAAGFAAAAGWEVVDDAYPILAVVLTHPTSRRRVGFRFLCDNWDELPPSLSLFDPDTGAELPWAKWPQGGWAAGNPHPRTHKPFLCLPGIREFHTHTSHLREKWDNLQGRDTYSLLYILHRVQDRFGDSNG
jgi:hypothetical protein